MNAISTAALRNDDTGPLLRRLWREHIRHHRGKLLVVLGLTLIMAGTQALYPEVIRNAVDMFARRDRRILYQVPVLVACITLVRAAAWYFQTVLMQKVVLLIIRELQVRMFTHLTGADLARVEREPPATLASRFTTDATIIREAPRVGRNDPCPCGSGKKYKKCHGKGQ